MYTKISYIKVHKIRNFKLGKSLYIAKMCQNLIPVKKNQAMINSPFSNLAIKTKYMPEKLDDVLYWP